MKAILKREWNAYFQNIIGWLYLAATAALYGLYFFVYNLNYGYAKVSYALNAITFLYLITVPVLTMRSLAEEQKSKTDQLILTAPVSVGKIVLAKYLAMAAVHTHSGYAASSDDVRRRFGSGKLRGRFGILPLRPCVYSDWAFCVVFDGKPGHFGCPDLCIFIFRLYDAKHYGANFCIG